MPVARVSHLAAEAVHQLDTDARYSQLVAEVLWAFTPPSAPAISGGRYSQQVAEVLHQIAAPHAGVSQIVAEVLISAAGPSEGGAIGGGSQTVSFGFAN